MELNNEDHAGWDSAITFTLIEEIDVEVINEAIEILDLITLSNLNIEESVIQAEEEDNDDEEITKHIRQVYDRQCRTL